jgi:hypothetical protein
MSANNKGLEAVRHHDDEGVTFGYPTASLERSCDHPFDFIRGQVLASSSGLVGLAVGRFASFCPKWWLADRDNSGHSRYSVYVLVVALYP